MLTFGLFVLEGAGLREGEDMRERMGRGRGIAAQRSDFILVVPGGLEAAAIDAA